MAMGPHGPLCPAPARRWCQATGAATALPGAVQGEPGPQNPLTIPSPRSKGATIPQLTALRAQYRDQGVQTEAG